jgi:X-Pro dipeptidyl-peptidase
MYTTPILKQPVHLSGTSTIKIRLASSKPAANLSVWMVSLPWKDGKNTLITDNIITRGWADPQNYRSIRKGEPLKPGKFYDLTFDLQPDDQVIPAGQQIGLMIFSSDREFTLWPDPGTELTVDLAATSITLPVVGGLDGWKKGQTDKAAEQKEEKPEEKKPVGSPSGPNSGKMWFHPDEEVLPLRLKDDVEAADFDPAKVAYDPEDSE